MWPDGWRYQGEFQGNLKHGEGRFEWSSQEFYEGQFYKDHRHGQGCYVWPDGTKFTGAFYLDRKDGYGTLEMKDGSMFQGLYKDDERFGPGVFTYPNGRQDVGLWYQNHLIRLSTAVAGAFSVKDHPMFNSDMGKQVVTFSPYKEKYLWRVDPMEDPFFYPYKKLLFDDSYTLPSEIGTYSNNADHLPLTRSYRREGDRHFFPEEELVAEDQTETIIVINKTPLLVQMQMHIHRHRHTQTKLPWDVAAVIEGNREGFGPKGPLECNSEQLLMATGEGAVEKVQEMLKTNLVSADVADRHGHTALIGASVACRSDIINILLDNGANVNKLNDEGVSALNSSKTLYYPVGSYKYKKVSPKAEVKKEEWHASRVSSIRVITLKEDGELTEEVKKAKRLSIYDRRIRLGSIILKTSPLVSNNAEDEMEGFGDSGEYESDVDDESGSLQPPSAGFTASGDPDSEESAQNFQLTIDERQLQRAADLLSRNKKFKESTKYASSGTNDANFENIRRIAEMKSEHRSRRKITNLLLRRGADPNISSHPMSSIFFSLMAVDIKAIKTLLENGVNPNTRLQTMKEGMNGLLPLHIAANLPGKRGVQITELLLNAGANPDLGAEDSDEIYGPDQIFDPELSTRFVAKSPNQLGVPKHYHSPSEIMPKVGGRTALHIACQREDDYKHAHQIVQHLLKHKANPNLLWSGHSPLSLAIASGNDLAVDELLANGADPNLPLTHGLGNALSVALSTKYEDKRNLQGRVDLVAKLIKAGANILMPITIQDKTNKAVGTALDYGHYKYYQDKRIAETPYHALSKEEREVYNSRRFLLNFLSEPFRSATIDKERKRFDNIIQQNIRTRAPGTISQLSESEALTFADISLTAQIIFERHAQKTDKTLTLTVVPDKKRKVDDKLYRHLFKFKFCYYCGRSVGVHLTPCTRCKEVYYCSKACKLAAWNEFHKDECYVVKGRGRGSSRKKKGGEKDGIKGSEEEDEDRERIEGEGVIKDGSQDWSISTTLSFMDMDNYSFN
ncbi:ankyrin repeat and MYND domain-containing protein 1 isoform X1 [Leucoraja erinacea]|uniref:ankyrin repeat and MYND domain-containing protein 1 isoform X1 n=1 Tax=Leucoraja erinaceus TaxID=7782 RepID=UPI00245571B4|nr:ankyrin repeat and MYND domain-containing protein 1 isoform X1 [Leucoraja erinacea]